MSNFNAWLQQVEDRAASEGPEAVAELESLRQRFRIAQMVISRRRQLDLTQSQLAGKCGLDQAEISRIECGRANPTLDTLACLAGSLQVQVCLGRETVDEDRIFFHEFRSPRPEAGSQSSFADWVAVNEVHPRAEVPNECLASAA